MPQEILSKLEFGEGSLVDHSLSENVRGLVGSEILKIAADVRELIAAGQPLCNLTVGDFDPQHFPVPDALLRYLQRALTRGETNYPPSNGLKPLREAVVPYNDGGIPNPYLDPKVSFESSEPLNLSEEEIMALVKFMEALDGEGYQDTEPTAFPQ